MLQVEMKGRRRQVRVEMRTGRALPDLTKTHLVHWNRKKADEQRPPRSVEAVGTCREWQAANY